jgi:hypothetical protein
LGAVRGRGGGAARPLWCPPPPPPPPHTHTHTRAVRTPARLVCGMRTYAGLGVPPAEPAGCRETAGREVPGDAV